MMGRTLQRLCCVSAVVGLAFASLTVAPVAAADSPSSDLIDWLTTVNYFRSMSGLPAVTENASLSASAVKHSCYMLQNGITHYEDPTKPGYTTDGEAAGRNSNVAVSSVFNESARSHIELWMTGPFHAIGVLRPNLKTVGFGQCDNQNTPTPWHSGATLDVLDGLGSLSPQPAPILFPGNGSTTSLYRFITESPNPLDYCGWSGQAGLPIIAMMPEGFSANPTATLSNSTGSQDICVLSSKNTADTAKLLLNGNNAVVIVPRAQLTPDKYNVSITTSARTVNWSFTVDPNAKPFAGANPTPTPDPATPTTNAPTPDASPAPTTTPLSSGATLHPLSPSRIVDTRAGVGSTPLVGSLTKRIQIAGRGGVPDGAQAVSGNFTVTNAASPGYLTAWNCSPDRPVVSTLNFAQSDTVPNGATVPLDATGGLCVFSSASTDLLIDVNGYYATGDGGRFASVTPSRLMDSRLGLGTPTRLAANTVVPLQVTGVAGVPAGASAVTLNVTSVDPSMAGFVSVYPCDTPRPTISSLNPVPGSAKPNVVITPIAADGTVCFYTLTDVDLVVDITGYLQDTAPSKFTSTTPFRLTDTRDKARVEMNNGTGGNQLAAGQVLTIQVAGQRGIATDAKAISANFTVLGAPSGGYLTAWPCGPQPSTSTVNYGAGNAVANGAQMPLSTTGQLCIYSSRSVHVIVDVNGWWS
ncbi:MAG: hypothetical protein JWL72_4431 [Ilumatobacteraceae bacterium]|nr:hypothetical protein [Ilumatobacteraceae bacterium]